MINSIRAALGMDQSAPADEGTQLVGIVRHRAGGKPYPVVRAGRVEGILSGSRRAIGAPRRRAADDDSLFDALRAFGPQRGRHAAMADGTARQQQPANYVPPVGEHAARAAMEETEGLTLDQIQRALTDRPVT